MAFLLSQAEDQKVRNTGRWSEEERAKFDAAFSEVGGNWKQISKRIGTRSNIQCRTHGQKIAAMARTAVQHRQDGQPHHFRQHLARYDDGDECDDNQEEKAEEGPSPPLSRVQSSVTLFQPLPPPWTYPYQHLELNSFFSNAMAANSANTLPVSLVGFLPRTLLPVYSSALPWPKGT
ncbi:hypothetical protein BASA81_002792 [Batrachochytrium salamandrivorans]|nr:hypothetical protein BASA81_002792 [Batrachochytrium salamandrivorans]